MAADGSLQPLAPLLVAGRVLVHELGHLWNRADVDWLGEGVARYLEVVFTVTLDGGDADRFGADFADAFRTYLDEGATPGSIASHRGPAAYAAGAAFTLCLDAHLRAAGADLLVLHRALRAPDRVATDGMLRGAVVATTLAARWPALAPQFEAWRTRPGRLDLVACAAGAGARARWVQIPDARKPSATRTGFELRGFGQSDGALTRGLRAR